MSCLIPGESSNNGSGRFESSEDSNRRPANPGFSCSINLQLLGVNVFVDSSPQSAPLGLRLTRTPSFERLLLETVLSRKGSRNHRRSRPPRPSPERTKASNFPILGIQIGNWRRSCAREGNLIAKLYFAKQKIVWEIVDGAFKIKMEMLWSDITAIKANIRWNQPGILQIELSRPPSFFQETDFHPRKHTNWQPRADFTKGQASYYRQHRVSFSHGVLDRHYEKLLQSNRQLYELSCKPFPTRNNFFHYLHQTSTSHHPPNCNEFGSELMQVVQPPYHQPHQIRPPLIIGPIIQNPNSNLNPNPIVVDFQHANHHIPRNDQIMAYQRQALLGQMVNYSNVQNIYINQDQPSNFNPMQSSGIYVFTSQNYQPNVEVLGKITDQHQAELSILKDSPSHL